MEKGFGKGTKVILLCVAAALIIGALLLNGSIEGQNPYEPVMRELRAHGYTVRDTDFYNAGSFPDNSVQSVLAGQDLSDAVEASLRSGFPGDINAKGDITALLLTLENKDIITIFTRDDHIELCFIQRLSDMTVYPITEAE